MNKQLEIIVYYMLFFCNPGISSVYFHAISVENTRVYLFDTYVIFACFSLKKTPFTIYVEYMLFTKKNICQKVITVSQK